MQYLAELIPEKDSLKLVKSEAEKYYKSHSLEDCFSMGDSWKVQEILAIAFDNHCKIIGYEAPLPWSPLSADVLDKYGVYWYIHM